MIQTPPTPAPGPASAQPEPASPADTARLIDEAFRAVDALSNHLQATGELERMYRVNAALRILWELH
jgi:hypothetical protein